MISGCRTRHPGARKPVPSEQSPAGRPSWAWRMDAAGCVPSFLPCSLQNPDARRVGFGLQGACVSRRLILQRAEENPFRNPDEGNNPRAFSWRRLQTGPTGSEFMLRSSRSMTSKDERPAHRVNGASFWKQEDGRRCEFSAGGAKRSGPRARGWQPRRASGP